ncbi:MAG: ABC transporter ATP-binding protein, partial [Acidobacteriota bacterium]
MIEVEGLSKSYGTVEALRGISFSVKRGEIVGLLGPNGAGKTTTMKILTGYLQPTDGTARIGGTDVLDDPLRVQAQVGYLPENAPIYLDMAVQEYLMLAADLREIPQPDRKALLSDAIHSTGIESYLTRPIGSLSKGYRQRVGLAQAILHRPSVLILDEPTNGLDPTQILE